MAIKDNYHYDKIAKAIEYLDQNCAKNPNLEVVAAHVGLSRFYFQKLFTDWAGVSPKKFLQYIQLNYAKALLAGDQKKASLFEVALQTGLSGTGRLHDLFIELEGMSPGEYKNGGALLTIEYGNYLSPFGEVFIASTSKGICHLSFSDEVDLELQSLKSSFPKASIQENSNSLHQEAMNVISNIGKSNKLRMHLKGTPFQLKVWSALLQIPMGELTTYGNIAKKIQQPNASRAVGTAIGNNPIAYLIPCHRIIQKSGIIGGYKWGPTRKKVLIGWEQSKIMT